MLEQLRQASYELKSNTDKLCQPITQFFQLRQFVYYEVEDSGSTFMLNSLPQHLSHYVEHQQYRHDPHIVHPDNMKPGIAFWETCDDGDFQTNYLFSSKHMFRVNHSISYVRKSKHAYKVYAFGTYDSNLAIYNQYFNHIGFIESFISYFDSHAASILANLKKISVDMNLLKGKKFIQQQGITKDNLSKEERSAFLSSLN